MLKALSAAERLVSEKTLEVALGAAATTYLSTHSLSAVAVAVLTAAAASLGIHVSGALTASAPAPKS
jgi:predicted alpha/beta hydrolase family esterase